MCIPKHIEMQIKHFYTFILNKIKDFYTFILNKNKEDSADLVEVGCDRLIFIYFYISNISDKDPLNLLIKELWYVLSKIFQLKNNQCLSNGDTDTH